MYGFRFYGQELYGFGTKLARNDFPQDYRSGAWVALILVGYESPSEKQCSHVIVKQTLRRKLNPNHIYKFWIGFLINFYCDNLQIVSEALL